MKTNFHRTLTALLGLTGGTLFAQAPHGTAEAPAAPPPGAAQVHTGASTFGKETDPATIDTPPPKLLPETKPASPGPGYVWVAGHYNAVKGEWQWSAGRWSLPPTPESVWIQGIYDPATKHWSEGHWQPDGKPAQKVEPNEKGPAAPN
ncbi:MAG TPA: hypothetical protein VG838_09150 [Opitutaceae bacterium]|nr:hypothetical protein [Opitutaceae bacterium]